MAMKTLILEISLVTVLAVIAGCLCVLTWAWLSGIHALGEEIRTEVSLVISQEIRRQDDRIQKRVERQPQNSAGQIEQGNTGAAPQQNAGIPATGTSLDRYFRGGA